MDNGNENDHQLRALAMRVTALEDNVAFLEQWCEEQQDILDRAAGPIGYDYELEPAAPPAPRTFLRVVDLRDATGPAGDAGPFDTGPFDTGPFDAAAIVAVVETEYDRKLRQIRAQLNRIRTRLALSVAPPPQPPSGPVQSSGTAQSSTVSGPPRGRVSAKPAGRTAP
jgi:hypothetical protein